MFSKKVFIIVVSLFLTITTLFAQEQETRQVREFNSISTYDGISVQLVPSEKNEVVLSGTSIDKVVTQVSGSRLKIKMDFGSNFKGNDNHIIVYYSKDIESITATEGSTITSNHEIKTNGKRIDLKAVEGAEIDLEVNVDKIKVKVSTGGEMKLKGKSETVVVNIYTGGSFDGKELKGKYGEVSISTGGSAKVYISEILDASVTMGGNIYYYGGTKTVNENISLGGSIIQK